MKRKIKAILAMLALGMITGVSWGSAESIAAPRTEIKIFVTSDVRAEKAPLWQIGNRNIGGLEVLSDEIQKERKENPNSLLIDGGNWIRGDVADQNYGLTRDMRPHPTMSFAKAMNYDFMVLGDVEQGQDLGFLTKYGATGVAPLLSSQLNSEFLMNTLSGSQKFKSYGVASVETKWPWAVKVGFLPLSSPGLLSANPAELFLGSETDDEFMTRLNGVVRESDILVLMVRSTKNLTAYQQVQKQVRLAKETGKVVAIVLSGPGSPEDRLPGEFIQMNWGSKGILESVPTISVGHGGLFYGEIEITLNHSNGGWKSSEVELEIKDVDKLDKMPY